MENMLSAGEINDFVGPQRFGKKARRARAASARMANKSKNNRLLEAFSLEPWDSSGLGGRLYHCCGSGHLKRFPQGRQVSWLGSIAGRETALAQPRGVFDAVVR